jgi:hypothetical protein
MVYALIGLPIFFLCAANTGSSMANAFRFIYSRICCGYCNYIKMRRLKLRLLNFANSAYASQPTTPTLTNNNAGSDGVSNRMLDYESDSIKPNYAQMNEVNRYVIEASINENSDYRKITVPISVTIFVLGSYIIIGASLFSTWEHWTFLEGAYFSFITMSTIGAVFIFALFIGNAALIHIGSIRLLRFRRFKMLLNQIRHLYDSLQNLNK